MKTANKFLCLLVLAATSTAVIATPTLAQMSAAGDVASSSRGDNDRGGDDTRADRDDDGGHSGPTRLVQVEGSGTAGPQLPDNELELTCGGPATWMASWLEDENGDPIPGTFDYECLDDDE